MKPVVHSSEARPADLAMAKKRRRVGFTLPNGLVVAMRRVEQEACENHAQLLREATGGKRGAEEGIPRRKPGVLPPKVSRGVVPLRRFKRCRSIDVATLLADSPEDAPFEPGDTCSGGPPEPSSGPCSPGVDSGSTSSPQTTPDGLMDELMSSEEDEWGLRGRA